MAKALGATENPPFDGFWHMKRGAPVENGLRLTKNGMFGEEVVKGKMRVSGDGAVIFFCYRLVIMLMYDPGTNQVHIFHVVHYMLRKLLRFTAQYKLPRNISGHSFSTCSLQEVPIRSYDSRPNQKKRQKTELEVDYCKYAFDYCQGTPMRSHFC